MAPLRAASADTNTAEQQANFVPNVRVEEVAQRQGKLQVSLPGTTLAFEAANIYARASGYVAKRYVDIGDHVKAGQLLAVITHLKLTISCPISE
jgi:multidrug efflux pump subunit AcrA (membrane-fusion protein)